MRCIEIANIARRALVLGSALGLAACAAMPGAPSAPARGPAAAAPAAPQVAPGVRAAYERALASLKAQRHADAERQLRELTTRVPELAGPWANLGILYGRTERIDDAIAALERAVELQARAVYYNELGLAYRAAGRFDRAKWAYEEAIALDAEYAYAHLNLGILCDLYLSEPDKALAYYERYRALAPSEAGTVAKWITDLKRRSNRTAEQSRGGNSG